MAENMLEIRGLRTGYGKVSVVNDIDVSVRPGEWVSIVGNNGAGKTTLLKSVVGLLPATGGSITFDGVDVTRVAPNKRIRMGMAFVPQGQQSFGQMTTRICAWSPTVTAPKRRAGMTKRWRRSPC